MMNVCTHKTNRRRYVLNPLLTQGKKVCLVDCATCEDKFVTPDTIRKNYYNFAEEGIAAEVVAFTGMKIGVLFGKQDIENHTITLKTKKGAELIFDLRNYTQINAKNQKFANKISYIVAE